MKSGFGCVCMCVHVCMRLEPSLDQSTTSVIQTLWQPLMCGVASCAIQHTHLHCNAFTVCVCEYILLCICAFICVLTCVHDVYLWHFNMCTCTCMQVCVQVCLCQWVKTNVIFDCVFVVFSVLVWQIDVCTDGGWWTYEFHWKPYILTWQQC